MISVTKLAHEYLASAILQGSAAIDLTAGNGLDTLFLAELVDESGIVHAFDIQPEAIAICRQRLSQASLAHRVHLNQLDHAHWPTCVPIEDLSRLSAVVMNLGYLPGGDHSITTKAESTIDAVRSALKLLRPGGRLSIVAYTGHQGGLAESMAIENVLAELDLVHFQVTRTISSPSKGAPIHYGIECLLF